MSLDRRPARAAMLPTTQQLMAAPFACHGWGGLSLPRGWPAWPGAGLSYLTDGEIPNYRSVVAKSPKLVDLKRP